jgi:hypothetical protein
MLDLTILIPSRGFTRELVCVIEAALQGSRVDRIIVSVNPGSTQFKKSLLDTINQRHEQNVVLVEQESDLGLYGNFRYLINKAESRFLVLWCTDDVITPDLEEVCSKMISAGAVLGISSWETREFYPGVCKHGELGLPGRIPDLSTELAKAVSSIWAEPSWIFGVWDTRFIQKSFSQWNFDWLDCYILAKAILSRSITLEVKNPTIIGTWNWANKIPHSVSGRYVNPYPVILLSCIFLVPTYLRIKLTLINQVLKRFLGFFRVARLIRAMNQTPVRRHQ